MCYKDLIKSSNPLVIEVQAQKNDHEVEKLLAQKSEITLKPVVEKTRILPKCRQTIEIEVDDEFLDLLKQITDLDSHLGFQTKSQALKRVMKFYLEKKHPMHKKSSSRERITVSKNVRHVSKDLESKVWKENQGQCAYVNPETKKICGSIFRIQKEHKIPIALGGKSTLDNLTLYCQAHNLYAAAKLGLLNSKSRQRDLFS